MARCTIDVEGLAQGVGFRPYVHGLAQRFGLGGVIYNQLGGARIEVEGESPAIARFVEQLSLAPPPIAAVARVVSHSDAPQRRSQFEILPSDVSRGTAAAHERPVVMADLATCDDCLRELFDPHDRRFGHPFINCARCGPRASIIVELPYDRERTTMQCFAMCGACREEYDTPSDRRFHAQPIACRGCGPKLRLTDAAATPLVTDDPLATFASAIADGKIGALKGIGGFHLVCDATNERAVNQMRLRKRRDAKPFAIMLRTLADVEERCLLDRSMRSALCSSARPIVLCPVRDRSQLPESLAPGMRNLGVLLPYTALHHLLLDALGDRPLVMTSGNLSGDPIACTDAEAFALLDSIVDMFLSHDRPIQQRCEDSVVHSIDDVIIPLRRSRGQAPLPIDLGFALEVPTLAVGGDFKAVFGLAVGGRALLSPHLGELDGLAAHRAWCTTVEQLERWFRIQPLRLVHDLHPDYATTRYAEQRALHSPGSQRVAVQHHHAHMASCMAEHGLSGDVIGVCFDGLGLGTDGTLWGGEFLVGGYARFQRAGHLLPVHLIGGDSASQQPWRVAVAQLRAAGLDGGSVGLERRIDARLLSAVERQLDKPHLHPRTSSMGRLFDSVAALTAVLDVSAYEGQSGMLLEALADSVPHEEGYAVTIEGAAPFVVDTAPLVRAIVNDMHRGVAVARIARRFHTSVVDMVALCCARIRELHGVTRVVLSGGVFANRILSREIAERLNANEHQVFRHERVPCNDGGLCLGQLAIAAHGGGYAFHNAAQASTHGSV